MVKDKYIAMNDQKYDLDKIHKIKSIPAIVSKNLLKIKLSYGSE